MTLDFPGLAGQWLLGPKINFAPFEKSVGFEMRTLIFVLACIGIGYGLASFQFQQRTAKTKNVISAYEDLDAAIAKAKAPDKKIPGRIEVVGGTDLDFGTMRKGSRRSHKFEFKNVGGVPVKLAFKSSTCKCTVGKFEAQELAPGESTEVELEWLAEKGTAAFAQTATITTNALDQEEIKLTIHGQVGQAFVFDPPEFNLGDFPSAEETEINGRIYSFEESPMDIKSGGWLDAVISKKIQVELKEPVRLEKGQVPNFADARHMMEFSVKFLRGLPTGNISGSVSFVKRPVNPLDAEEFVYLPVRGRVYSVITVVAGNDYNEERNIFSMGNGTTRDGLKKSFLLRIKKEDIENPTIKVAEIRPESISQILKVSIGEPSDTPKQKIYPITIEIPPGSPEIELDGTFAKEFAKIVLETNIESAPIFPMFIRFSIKD